MKRAIIAALALLGACSSAPAPQIAPPPPPPLPIARSATPRSFAVLDTGAARVNILVATTRVATMSDRPGDRYGVEDADQLQFAQVGVNVPSYRARGTGELPRAGTLRSDDPKSHFFVTSVIPVDSNRFVQRVAADLAGTRSRNILVFVHGFNTSFEDAAEYGDPRIITKALGNVARAQGMTRMAEDAELSRTALYRALSADGRPELSTIFKVMQALGLRLAPVRMKPAA